MIPHRLLPLLALASASAILSACSRSGLDLGPIAGGPSAEGGLPMIDATAPPEDGGATATGCTAALLAGATTPMSGYCSTRANLSSGVAPTSPTIAWRLAPKPALAYSPPELVVDDEGRAYATIDTNMSGNFGTPDSVMAVDADGTVAWTTSFPDDVPRDLFLGKDGKLRVELDSSLALFDRDGTLAATYALPTGLRGLAVGQDGSLFASIETSPWTSVQFTKLSPTGETVWTSATFSLCSLGTSPIALRADDRAVVAFTPMAADGTCPTTRLVELGGSGEVVWEKTFVQWMNDPAIAPDGTIRFGVGETSDPTASAHLLSLDGSGDVLWDVDLGADESNVGETPFIIDADRTTVARTSAGLVAVSASGKVLWTMALSSSFAFSGFVDARGELVVNDGDTLGIDVATGEVRWTLKDPIEPPIALAPGGVMGVVGDFAGGVEFFLAGDPR